MAYTYYRPAAQSRPIRQQSSFTTFTTTIIVCTRTHADRPLAITHTHRPLRPAAQADPPLTLKHSRRLPARRRSSAPSYPQTPTPCALPPRKHTKPSKLPRSLFTPLAIKHTHAPNRDYTPTRLVQVWGEQESRSG